MRNELKVHKVHKVNGPCGRFVLGSEAAGILYKLYEHYKLYKQT